ncbi:DUF1801 domain-containing protein [Flavihumibacter rivuli]|uniref:DUF1801 domain-containing protein n=1 Tax=Flavihumibacter rivuli TaxID=2838156 RepID=UPI001BDF45C3|nr:DUF1801 domain-containing protein [Flavihumibacter rivuli]ULQ57196.1 DUF1801 domain-containing protein [Flavihumibacter rivuli]
MASSSASSPEQYLRELDPERKEAMEKLRKAILKHLPKGFSEEMNYGMIGYVVPHSLYPPGYHCQPSQPLPFMGIAAQKNHYALYHMGIYSDPALKDWFIAAYEKFGKAKLDMGKSCIRFKKAEHIPFELIGELAGKMTPKQWIALYESALKK